MKQARTPRAAVVGQTPFWIAMLLAIALSPHTALAQENAETGADDPVARYLAPPNDSVDAPGPHWNRFHKGDASRELIEDCLADQDAPDGDTLVCLGVTMSICMSYAINQTTQGSVLCASGEAEAWDAILADAYAQGRSRMDAGAKAALTASQEAWTTYRDAACDVWGEVFRGGSIARQISADCYRDLTGRRALDVIDVAGSVVQ